MTAPSDASTGADLLSLPHRRARALLGTGAPVFVPVNPVEYHGFHLSLHNDGLISAGLIADIHRRLAERHPDWPLLRVADLEMGVEPVPGPGSRPLPFPVVVDAIRRTCSALADLGARRVVLVTFHGAPLHNLALEQGVRLLQRRGVAVVAPVNLLFRRLVSLQGAELAPVYEHVSDEAERAELMATAGTDFHAGLLETSLALHYAPASVHPELERVPPCPRPRPNPALLRAARVAGRLGRDELARELRFAAVAVGWNELRPFPGYTGSPHRASAAAGAFLADLFLNEAVPVVEAVLESRATSPPPIMPWLRYLTLEGRAGRHEVRPDEMLEVSL